MKMLTGIVAVAMLGAGCGSLCSHATDTNAKIKEAAKACQGVNVNSVPESECENDIAKCTDADLDKLEAALTCMDKVGACVSGQELAWAGSLAQCAPTGLSTDCKAPTAQ